MALRGPAAIGKPDPKHAEARGYACDPVESILEVGRSTDLRYV